MIFIKLLFISWLILRQFHYNRSQNKENLKWQKKTLSTKEKSLKVVFIYRRILESFFKMFFLVLNRNSKFLLPEVEFHRIQANQRKGS